MNSASGDRRGRRTRIKMDGDEGERGAVGPWDAEADR